jgi:hypothetical protein
MMKEEAGEEREERKSNGFTAPHAPLNYFPMVATLAAELSSRPSNENKHTATPAHGPGLSQFFNESAPPSPLPSPPGLHFLLSLTNCTTVVRYRIDLLSHKSYIGIPAVHCAVDLGIHGTGERIFKLISVLDDALLQFRQDLSTAQ